MVLGYKLDPERPAGKEIETSADPLEAPPPSFSIPAAEGIAEQQFGIRGTAAPLDSERDQNFRLKVPGDVSYLLKISNPADDDGAVEMQTLAAVHLARQCPELPVMQPIETLDGSYFGKADGHLVRMFTFLPGRMMSASEVPLEAIGAFGAMVAGMGLGLRSFFHPAGGYRILWDLKNTPNLRPMLQSVDDPAKRRIAEVVLDRFDDRVRGAFPALRAQLIHNDLTLDNVLLDDDYKVSGIVDFGDLTHTALICDLAIALVSLMWGRDDPLAAADIAIGGYSEVLPIEADEADVLADLVAARLAALTLIAAWRVRRYPENAEYITANVDLAWDLLEQLDSLGWPAVAERMKNSCLEPRTAPRPPSDELIQRRRRVLGPALAPLSYDRPLHIVRAEGSRMFDERGIGYVDAYNNVPVVGHSHPRVVKAIAEQSRTLNTNTRYLHSAVVELAERLVATMPEGLDTVMFVNSGSEANDITWRLATEYTGRSGGIVTDFAYHGVTSATIALSPEEWAGGSFPHIATVPPPRAGIEWAPHFEAALTTLDEIGVGAAAFYVDSLFTSDGIYEPPPDQFRAAIERLRARGCLVVADEVQGGFGRTGSHMWSFGTAGTAPDFVTLGKPMGNGHPVAAVVMRREIAERFASRTDMFSTFGGNPVACRAALAVLDVIDGEGLQAHAADVGAHLRARLLDLSDSYDSIADVRGIGLMIGVEFVDAELANAVMNDMRERGVLVGTTGRAGNVLKIRPPLVITTGDADLIADTLEASLCALSPSSE